MRHLLALGLAILTFVTVPSATAAPDSRDKTKPTEIGPPAIVLTVDTTKAAVVLPQAWSVLCEETARLHPRLVLAGQPGINSHNNLVVDFRVERGVDYQTFLREANSTVESLVRKVSNRALVITFCADEAGVIQLGGAVVTEPSGKEQDRVTVTNVGESAYPFLQTYVADRPPLSPSEYIQATDWHVRRLVRAMQAFHRMSGSPGSPQPPGKLPGSAEFAYPIETEAIAIRTYDRITPDAKPLWQSARLLSTSARFTAYALQVDGLDKREIAIRDFRQRVKEYEDLSKRMYWSP